jgi:uncharacterized membrane protein (UPF0127 family)
MKKLVTILVILLGVGGIGIFLLLQQSKTPTATINTHTFKLEIAKTQAQQEKGLGLRDSLPKNTGMLFPYTSPRELTFWMKGMRFPIDIIYLRDKKIIKIYSAVSQQPEGTPDTQLPLYPSQGLADMVLEINAGLSQQYRFEVGDSVNLSL